MCRKKEIIRMKSWSADGDRIISEPLEYSSSHLYNQLRSADSKFCWDQFIYRRSRTYIAKILLRPFTPHPGASFLGSMETDVPMAQQIQSLVDKYQDQNGL